MLAKLTGNITPRTTVLEAIHTAIMALVGQRCFSHLSLETEKRWAGIEMLNSRQMPNSAEQDALQLLNETRVACVEMSISGLRRRMTAVWHTNRSLHDEADQLLRELRHDDTGQCILALERVQAMHARFDEDQREQVATKQLPETADKVVTSDRVAVFKERESKAAAKPAKSRQRVAA